MCFCLFFPTHFISDLFPMPGQSCDTYSLSLNYKAQRAAWVRSAESQAGVSPSTSVNAEDISFVYFSLTKVGNCEEYSKVNLRGITI